MIKAVYSLDTHNQRMSIDEVAMTLRSSEGGDSKAKILIIYEDETDNTDRKEIL